MNQEKKYYSITDLQSDEKHELLDEEDVLIFANEIFWDEPETEFTDVQKAITAIEVSDYEVKEVRNVRNKLKLETEFER